MNDKVKPIKPTGKPDPGHADILEDPLLVPHRVCVMAWQETLQDVIEFARDNGKWFATGTEAGAISPETAEKELQSGKKLWQIFGLPVGFNMQQLGLTGGDIVQVELIDPLKAVQTLQSRAKMNEGAAEEILKELRGDSGAH